MTDVLTRMAGVSLGGGAVVVLLLVLGRVTRGRYGARWRCWAWLLLALRLAVPLPLLPEGNASAPIQIQVPPDRVLYHATAAPRPSGPAPSQPVQTAATSPAASQSTDAPEEQTPAYIQQTGPTITAGNLLMALWLLGGAVVLGYNLVAHLRFRRYLARWCRPVEEGDTIRLFNGLCDSLSLHCRPRLRVCPGLAVPMLAGLFRPVLLLPEDAAGSDGLGYALLHELIHYRRRDIWLKALVLWVNAVHWFNPLVWLMVRAVERDTELACDEGALKRLPPEEHAAYGRAILQAVAAVRKEKS